MKNWTMQDFKKGDHFILFRNNNEFKAFMNMCEKEGIKWHSGDKPSEWKPMLPAEDFSVSLEKGALTYGLNVVIDYVKKVREKSMFEDMAKPDGKAKLDRKRKNYPNIIITTDGTNTIATMHIDGNVVKMERATCAPEDKFDYVTGVKMVIERLFEKKKDEKSH